MKVKVKIAADTNIAAPLRSLVGKVAAAEIATTPEEVQVIAWLLEIAREINIAGAERMSLTVRRDPERGHEMVLPR